MSTPAINKRPESSDLILSVQDLKDFFLFGIDLTNDDGEPYPEPLYEFYIRSAQEWLEMEVPGLLLTERDVEEHHDYYATDYQAFAFLKLWRFPVQSVETVAIQFPLATDSLKFDPSWYRAQSVGAQVQLIPTQGTFSSILLSQGGSFLPLFFSGTQQMPSIWRVKYRAGFEVGKCPQNIREIIGMKAAMGPLNIAGDLIAGAGIATKSIGIDGLSQSISTTASATNAGYGARILQYNKEVSERLKKLQSFYGGISMVVA